MSSTDERGPGDDADAPAGARGGVALRRVRLRATVGRIAAGQVEQLREVAGLVAECAAAARRELADVPPGWGVPSVEELTNSTVIHEVMVTLGIATWDAERLVERATQLVGVLPETLAALESGRIDLARAQALVLGKVAAGDGPWAGLSPRAWRAQIRRAVVAADVDAARRRREDAIRERAVRAWARGDGTAVLQVIGRDCDIAFVHGLITDLACAYPALGPDGKPLSMDQRSVDAFVEVFRRLGAGDDLPLVRVRREREIGLVLHADAFFGDGPAKGDPGELRGLGAPAPVDPVSAAQMARDEIKAGAATRVLLVGSDGVVQRTIRLPHRPAHGWTRDFLNDQVRAALPDLPPLQTENYEPTVAITDHVRAVHPRCTSYDCARLASRCDLDHDTAYPRGPTSVTRICVHGAGATTK